MKAKAAGIHQNALGANSSGFKGVLERGIIDYTCGSSTSDSVEAMVASGYAGGGRLDHFPPPRRRYLFP